MAEVTVQMSGRTAVGLRYVLPLVAESVRHAEPTGDRANETFAMLEQAVQDIDRALPPEFRGLIDDADIAERRMDAIDAQLAAGVRFPTTEDNPKDCGGRGTQPDKRGATSAAGCPGCTHPECPNREADRG